MKRGLIIAAFVLLLGAATYWLCYRLQTHPVTHLTTQTDAEMAWLADEYGLTAEQRERVTALHATYDARCMEMCRKIAENRSQLDRLISQNRSATPEMEALLQDSARIQVECRRDMLEQIYAVAAVMSPEQGARYIAQLKAQVLQPGTPHPIADR